MSVAFLSLLILLVVLAVSILSHWCFPADDHPRRCMCATCYRRNLRHGGTL